MLQNIFANNFAWEKCNRKSILSEKPEIVLCRRKYVRQIKKLHSEEKEIFYLDETWLNKRHAVPKMWHDKNLASYRQAFLEGWSTGINPPSSKDRRLMITYIGNANGFVDNGLLVFESKHTRDYHEALNANVFGEYFEQMLSFIPDGAVIVMDTASLSF